MKAFSRVKAQVNLDSFNHNLDEINRLTKADTKIIAVIKTDGYGHGASWLASQMEDRDEIWGYAVAAAAEACKLRNAGMKKPILILGYVFPEDYDDLVSMDIRPAVFDLETAKLLSEAAAKQRKTVNIHIKIDTGMSRIGFQVNEEAADVIKQISELENVKIEGMFTHFAKADEYDKTAANNQHAKYFEMVKMLKERGVEIPIKHISNSAAIIDLPDFNYDIVRAGIILYGLWPSDEVMKDRIDLKPLLELKSHIVHIKELEEGRQISYGGTYVVPGTRKYATVPVGYGDGYPRGLSNKGYVLINGCKAPICGRVCMDQFMVDITDIPDVKRGDEVVLVGRSGNEVITVEELGDISGRFNYEFVCDLGKRIPREYIKDGKVIGQSE